MTPYQRVYEQLAPCRTLTDLSYVWQSYQATLKAMPVQDMLALTGMKDMYKRLIIEKKIDEYLKTRKRVAAEYQARINLLKGCQPCGSLAEGDAGA